MPPTPGPARSTGACPELRSSSRHRHSSAVVYQCSSVASCRSGVGESRALHRNELPVIARLVKCKSNYAESGIVPDFAVGRDATNRIMAGAAGAHHELPDAVAIISVSIAVHRAKPLVDVI